MSLRLCRRVLKSEVARLPLRPCLLHFYYVLFNLVRLHLLTAG